MLTAPCTTLAPGAPWPAFSTAPREPNADRVKAYLQKQPGSTTIEIADALCLESALVSAIVSNWKFKGRVRYEASSIRHGKSGKMLYAVHLVEKHTERDDMNEELATARGQVGVLRDLLMEALSIIDTIAAENEDESYLLEAFEAQAKAAIEGTQP